MSSLQKQLASIAANSNHELDLKAQKTAHSKSLLFDPQHAATQSFENIYQICVEGFEELCALDSRFVAFAKSIFSPQSKSEDRTQMTQSDNQELDRILEAFLGLVGSRLLLKPALKAVEWLVRRFRVHESNTDYLILTFLPYHMAPVFSVLLSILPKQLSPSFRFLHPYVSSVSNPPRAVFVQTAVQQHGFFAAFNEYMLVQARSRYHYSALVSFWASTIVQAIDMRLQSSQAGRQNIEQQRQDDVLTQILPTLSEALSIKKAPELTLGCYMIAVILAAKLDLEDAVLDALMIEVCNSWTADTLDAGIGCISALAERRTRARLPSAVIKSAFRVDQLATRLVRLSKQQSVERLTSGLAVGFIDRYASSNIASVREFLLVIVRATSLGSGVKLAIAEKANENEQLAELKTLMQAEFQNELLAANDRLEEVGTNFANDAKDDAIDPDLEQPSGTVDLDIALPKTVQQSFLSTCNTEDENRFGMNLAKVFEKAANHRDSTQRFFNYSLFQPEVDPNQVRKVSFLLKASCSSQSAVARLQACHLLSECITADSGSNFDYQAIIPYALTIMTDDSAKVRQAGVVLFSALQEAYETVSRSDQKPIWGNSLYNPKDSQTGSFATKTAGEFLKKVISPALEECALDRHQIGRVLQDSLDDSNAHSSYDSKEKRLKSAHRGETFEFLCQHSLAAPSCEMKFQLVAMLGRIGKSGSHYRSKALLPIAKEWADTSGAEYLQPQARTMSLDEIDNSMVAVVHPSDQEALTWLLSLARGQIPQARMHLQQATVAHLRQIWVNIKDNKQKEIGHELLEGALQPEEPWRSCANELLTTLPISPYTFVGLLHEVLAALDAREQSASKRRKIDPGNAVQSQASSELRYGLAKLNVLLETLDGSKLGHDLDLFYALFSTLQHLQLLKSQQGSDLGYIKGLTLSSLSAMMADIDKHTPQAQLDSTVARPDLLVECIRESPNAQSRNSAILLLASLAKRVPQKILHTVMPIFTLISASTARQNDDFSIHVVNQTIQEVVPLLAETLRKQDRDLVSATAEIITSFAAAFEHIPGSRRLHLYTLLVSSLGAEESLFAVLAALVNHAPESQEIGRFATQMLKHFSSLECLSTVSKYLGLCLNAYQPQQSLYQTLIKSDSPGMTTHLVLLLPSLLRDSSLQNKVRQDITEGTHAAELRSAFAKSIELTIKLSQTAKEDDSTRSACSKVLEVLLKLVPFEEFLVAVQPLLDTVDTDLCRSILRAMELQVRSGKHASQQSRQAALDCTSRLVKILKTSDQATLKYSAVACLDQICEKFGKVHLPTTFEAAEAVSSQQCMTGKDTTLRSLSLHCLATTVDVLGNEFIPLLQRSIEAAAECLEESIAPSSHDIRMHNASYALFIAAADQVPFMISAKYLAVIARLSQASAQAGLGAEADDNRAHFTQVAATKLDMGVVCEVAATTWPSAMQQGFKATEEHISLFRQTIDNHAKSVISKHVRACFTFMTSALDFRRTASGVFTDEEILSVERQLLDTLVALIMKINDAVFRPYFIQLLEWSSGPSKADLEGRKLRGITFFSFMFALSDRLKSLVTAYFGYAVERASEILTDTSNDSVSTTLRSAVIKALSSSFAHDQEEFWASPTRFDTLLPALMGQMTLSPIQMPRISNEVIPSVVEFAAASNSNDHLKDMDGILLKQLRHENVRVRLTAVKCQMALTERLGEDWLTLLPEMLPSISELQDDDDERVERETHRWVRMIEGLLGESLDSMLQ